MSLKNDFTRVELAVESVMDLLNGQHYEAAALIGKKLIVEVERFKAKLEPVPVPDGTLPLVETPAADAVVDLAQQNPVINVAQDKPADPPVPASVTPAAEAAPTLV